MTSRVACHGSRSGARLFNWIWFCIWLAFAASSVNCAANPRAPSDVAPRAVFVALAYEHELEPILSSIRHVENSFNKRHLYNWVFFSTAPLSEEFRRLTSNATNATCMYEVVQESNLGAPGGSGVGAAGSHGVEYGGGLATDARGGGGAVTPLLGQVHRWKSGHFANEGRLKDYDWFWRIEPGTQFVQDVNFDVFRAMRDHGIVYGSSRAGFDEARMRSLSAHVQGFIDANPNLVHAEADMSWLLGTAGQGDAPDGAELGSVEQAGERLLESDMRASSDGVDGVAGLPGSDAIDLVSEDMTEASSPAEAFASWLASPYKSSVVAPGFEIGSLAFLRSQSHQALLKHLDRAGGFYYDGPRDMSTPTISAGIFLPQKSVIRFRAREGRCPSPPDSTPEPRLGSMGGRRGGDSGIVAMLPLEEARPVGSAGASAAMADSLAFWALVAKDFGKQGGMPGLRSGNTVVDERNFILGRWK